MPEQKFYLSNKGRNIVLQKMLFASILTFGLVYIFLLGTGHYPNDAIFMMSLYCVIAVNTVLYAPFLLQPLAVLKHTSFRALPLEPTGSLFSFKKKAFWKVLDEMAYADVTRSYEINTKTEKLTVFENGATSFSVVIPHSVSNSSECIAFIKKRIEESKS